MATGTLGKINQKIYVRFTADEYISRCGSQFWIVKEFSTLKLEKIITMTYIARSSRSASYYQRYGGYKKPEPTYLESIYEVSYFYLFFFTVRIWAMKKCQTFSKAFQLAGVALKEKRS